MCRLILSSWSYFENLSQDFVKVYDGESTADPRILYWPSAFAQILIVPTAIRSTSPVVFVEFVTGEESGTLGFSATYTPTLRGQITLVTVVPLSANAAGNSLLRLTTSLESPDDAVRAAATPPAHAQKPPLLC